MRSPCGHSGSPKGPIFLRPCCCVLCRPRPVPGGGSTTQLRANTRRVGVTSPLRTCKVWCGGWGVSIRLGTAQGQPPV